MMTDTQQEEIRKKLLQSCFDSRVTILKKYNNDVYKLVYMPKCRKQGKDDLKLFKPTKPRTPDNDKKNAASISRTKRIVREYGLCNPWQYFATLTFRPEGATDRYSLHDCTKKLLKWLNNFSVRYCDHKLKYLLIPEPHKDGAIHFHGLFYGIPPAYIKSNQYGYLEFVPLSKKFGFNSMSKIKDINKCANYILKYISKEVGKIISLFKHSYFASKGLKKAAILARIVNTFAPLEFDVMSKEGGVRIINGGIELIQLIENIKNIKLPYTTPPHS